MAKAYSEDLLIQKPTAELLEKELGWKSVYAFDKRGDGVSVVQDGVPGVEGNQHTSDQDA